MDQEKASNTLAKSVIKINAYAILLSAVTAVLHSLIVALLLFPVYLYILASIPYFTGVKQFSERQIIGKIIKGLSKSS